MGKHNGKARKSGMTVGHALVNRARREGRTNGATAHQFTTEAVSKNMQSVIEHNDLEEMMAMATLADKDFSAERHNVMVISTGAVPVLDEERAAESRKQAEDRHRHRLTVPRRPSWTRKTTPEELDAAERSYFLAWRRGLAELENEETLVLTPFEKNLEVWRQLWRVLERSDAVVQVVDARDPLTYACPDLEAYAREIHPTKSTILLLNKADLLPPSLRAAWADYFDQRDMRYAFWSAKAATQAEEDEENPLEEGSKYLPEENENVDPRARLLSVDGLLELLHRLAQEAVTEAAMLNVKRGSHADRLVVGLTGYPNVGKSSTINALFGSKKTAVAPTPGKTKHFQTLNVDDDLMLCDCPGLVMPQYANSKAEMVAAGVIPVDRLTDVRAPVGAICERISRQQFANVYSLPMQRTGHASAVEVMRALALSRGWVSGSGLPDETRTGRRILKDYVDGKLLSCRAPPGASPDIEALVGALSREGPAKAREGNAKHQAAPNPGVDHLREPEEPAEPQLAASSTHVVPDLDDADLDLLEELRGQGSQGQGSSGKAAKAQRAAHKFQKKPARSKGTRGKVVDSGTADGSALVRGKGGGYVRMVPSLPTE